MLKKDYNVSARRLGESRRAECPRHFGDVTVWYNILHGIYEGRAEVIIEPAGRSEVVIGPLRSEVAKEVFDLIRTQPKTVARYNLYYRKYNIIANAYIPYVKVVETEDIYHEIGKMICESLEKIENIRYSRPKASREECEKLWAESGYQQITPNLWRKEKDPEPSAAKNENAGGDD